MNVAAYVETLGLPEPQGRGLSKRFGEAAGWPPSHVVDWLVVGHTLEGNPAQERRGWVRLHEKGGKECEAPCVPKLEQFLDEYIAAAGIAAKQNEPLFRTTCRSTGTAPRLTRTDLALSAQA